MPRCTRKGCQKEFDESSNEDGSCKYHPGGPVFHEGLKSWSCCNEVNKPVLEFDAFMEIPPCTTGKHSTEAPPKPVATTAPAEPAQGPTKTVNGVETYGQAAPPSSSNGAGSSSKSAPVAALPPAPTPVPAPAQPKETEEDDLSVPVPSGATCKRLGCGATWQGEDISRGSGEQSTCRYHPQSAIFHEGSKGYLCCKRRVLEFSEFLKIEGCTEGNHLFVGAKRDESVEEMVDCRVDFYQTPTQVHVSAFAKGADKSKSTVRFDSQQLHFDFHLPSNKRIAKSLTLYGPIDPASSTFRIVSTKVDITLIKSTPASWPLLELPAEGTELPPGYALTFGVSGRTGTVGGKEIVLAPEEAARRLQQS
ncbi:HSP20-like chaperone [Kockovaella imperatae]|uniref:HSP20-like chaperone n=1 Tax=Kockovaella imperatae TaxID=4999 RepID=A0A1Y1UEV8_9TREE|nr:HSP20-like chaperone [Kockovaella imperatae]ORX36519.1 HSP20-like chaperone [Kockovaella imperatae]